MQPPSLRREEALDGSLREEHPWQCVVVSGSSFSGISSSYYSRNASQEDDGIEDYDEEVYEQRAVHREYFWNERSSHQQSRKRIKTSDKLTTAFYEACTETEDLPLDATDHTIAQLQQEKLRIVFEKLDTDNDGYIKMEDMESLLSKKLEVNKQIIFSAVDSLFEEVQATHATTQMKITDLDEDSLKLNELRFEPQRAIEQSQFAVMIHRNPELLRCFFEDAMEKRERLQRALTLQSTPQKTVSEDYHYWKNSKSSWKLLLFWLLIDVWANVTLFALQAHKYKNHEEAQAVFGNCVVVALGAAQCLNMNCCLILLPTCRHFMAFLQQTAARIYFPFEKLAQIHMLIGTIILFLTFLHMQAHICDVARFSHADTEDIYALFGDKLGHVPEEPWRRWIAALLTRSGVTGIIMLLCMLGSVPLTTLRRRSYDTFWKSHHLLIVMLLALCLHGTGNLLEPFQSIYWLMPPLFLYLVPRFLRETSLTKCEVLEASMRPGNCVCLRLAKPQYYEKLHRPGMHCLIQIPAISATEWHPFTITSSPSERFLEFHIDCNGSRHHANDWKGNVGEHIELLLADGTQIETQPSGTAEESTEEKEMETDDIESPAAQAEYRETYPEVSQVESNAPTKSIQNMIVKVEGPFGSSSQAYKDFSVAVLVVTDVGAIPMLSVLKSLLASPPDKLKRVFFYWTTAQDILMPWFSDLLEQADFVNDPRLSIRHFVNEVDSDLRDPTEILCYHATRSGHYSAEDDLIQQVEVGHPIWPLELEGIMSESMRLGENNAGIFVCGNDMVAGNVAESAKKLTNKRRGPKFHFHYTRETF